MPIFSHNLFFYRNSRIFLPRNFAWRLFFLFFWVVLFTVCFFQPCFSQNSVYFTDEDAIRENPQTVERLQQFVDRFGRPTQQNPATMPAGTVVNSLANANNTINNTVPLPQHNPVLNNAAQHELSGSNVRSVAQYQSQYPEQNTTKFQQPQDFYPIQRASGTESHSANLAISTTDNAINSPMPIVQPVINETEPTTKPYVTTPSMEQSAITQIIPPLPAALFTDATTTSHNAMTTSASHPFSPTLLNIENKNSENITDVSPALPPLAEKRLESSGPKYSDGNIPELLGPEDGEKKTGHAKKDGLLSSLPPFVAVAASLTIVLGAFFIMVWLMKRAVPRGTMTLPQEVFEKLGSVQLTQKMQMHLFRLGGKLVLVSVTPDGMEPVAEVTDPDEVVHLIGLCRQNDKKSASALFRKALNQYAGHEKNPQQPVMMTTYQQQPQQQYPQRVAASQPITQQPAARRSVGVVSPAKAYQR